MCYMIYLDNAATSFYKPKEVKDAVKKSLEFLTANPGRSAHKPSRQIADVVYETREVIKNFFDALDYEVVFTKNSTEALNLAILGTLNKGDHVVCTCYEHNSVLRPLEHLKSSGIEYTVVECVLIDFHKEFIKYIKPNTKLVITNAVSNVTGEVCDIESVGKFCKDNHILYLVDGAQSSGHEEISLKKSNVDMYAFSGHKGLLSITGVGGLIVRKSHKLNPILFGGTGTESENLNQPLDLPDGYEAGTIPTIPIASLKAGIEYLNENFEKIYEKEQILSNYLYNSLKNLDFLTIYSKPTSKNVFSFNVKGKDSSMVANILDEYNICVRSGLHCAPLVHKYLKTIESGAVRVSLDFHNTKQDIDYLIKVLKIIYHS